MKQTCQLSAINQSIRRRKPIRISNLSTLHYVSQKCGLTPRGRCPHQGHPGTVHVRRLRLAGWKHFWKGASFVQYSCS